MKINNKLLLIIKDFSPALIILILSMIYAVFFEDIAIVASRKSTLWIVSLRFLRFTFFLCIPLIVLPPLYRFIIKKISPLLIQIGQKKENNITFLNLWLFRPLQGIGIGLFFGIKLISVLQLISNPVENSPLLLPEGHFQFERIIIVTLITILVSTLLSILWTMDDKGVRYFNSKEREIKMVGKYAGTILPFIFSIYGILNLLSNFPTEQAIQFAFRTAVILYPPLSVFTIIHSYFIKNKKIRFSYKNLHKVKIII